MESCSDRKSVKQIKIYFILEFLQIAMLCLDDSFAHSWHSLNQLHLECLEGVPTYPEHLMTVFSSLCGLTHPKPLQLVEVGGFWRPGHLMQHSITLFLGKVALKQPGGSLPCCKTNDSPTKPKPDGMVYCSRMLL